MPLLTTPSGKRVSIHKDAYSFIEPGEGGLTSKVVILHTGGVTTIEVTGTVDTVDAIMAGRALVEGA